MDDRQIINEFVIESREHLADIEQQLLAIENAGAAADPELVNTVFRAIHSIKGSASFLGFSTVGRLAHDLENVLNLVRNGQLVPNAAATDVLLRSADKLRTMIDDIDHSNDSDISAHLEALQAIVAGLLADECPEAAALGVGGGDEAGFEPVDSPAETTLLCAPGEEPVVDGDRMGGLPDDCGPLEPLPAAPTAVPTRQGEPSGNAPASTGGTPTESNIRVAVTVLDRLMNLAGELVLSRNQLLQSLGTSDHVALSSVAARVNQVTSELQETIMQTRLQPIGTVFGRFPRVVRDLSNALGKQCQLSIDGQEVELDKSIIEAVGDPLTHLIRNAVDHGIESPQDRLAAGKPPTGSIALRAFHQAGKVNIQISDDGRGIDAKRLREKAVAKGLLTAEQAAAMSDREALLLIFRPGFSMAERVTGVSGRGVGMDVVKTNIERLGGTVAVDTQLGHGTTIHVRLPLTLAIIPSLVVRCGGRPYAIPQASIRELVRVKASEVAERIERIQSSEVFRLREVLLPLVRLDAALELQSTDDSHRSSHALHIIVVEAGHLRYGLVVDGLCDSEEIVVKPLGRHMKQCTCMAGATILGDGNVALILDIAGIAAYSHLTFGEDDAADDSSARDAGEETQAVLLFSNHPKEFFGIPMDTVARLERIRVEQIDTVGGCQILQYRGSTLPLIALDNCIDCQPRPDTARMYVVVFNAAGREVGLIVPELLDIRSIPLQVDTSTFREPGILGSLVFEEMTVRLVDLHELARKIHPDWYSALPQSDASGDGGPRVLVVEDSEFFRKQLVNFLEAEGYQTCDSEDGAAAWNVLQDADQHFDLVVTDIEMPRMDGFELAQHIRGDRHLAGLPIVAVTSLAGEDDERRGRDIGIDEYHVKLDRESLLNSVARLLRTSAHTALARSSS